MQIKKLLLGTTAAFILLTSVSAWADYAPTSDASQYSDTARQPDGSDYCDIVGC